MKQWAVASGLFALFLGIGTTGAAAEDALTVTSWGGAYTAAQTEAFHKPFTQATGTKINSVDYNGGMAEIKAQVESGNVTWDLVDVELSDAVRGCEEGLYEKIDRAILAPAPDNTTAEKDFLPGTLGDCSVGTAIVSTVIAYDKTKFPDAKPETAAHFFDIEKFPGKRGIKKAAMRTFEMVLMADGVPPEDVYKVLATPEGVDRVFKKLDTIRPQIIWWEAGAQPPQLLADGEVSMTTSYNGRIFDAQTKEKKPFEIIWDGQAWELSVWVVPRGAPNKDVAMKLVAFSTKPDRLGAMSSQIAYGPTRKSALEFVGKNPATGTEMGPHMPTIPEHMKRAVPLDVEFWADRGAELEERFATWLAKGQ